MTSGLDPNQFIQLSSREAYKQFYDDQGMHYGNHHITSDFPRAAFVLERLKPADNVLEMGCQTGGITRLVAPKVNSVIANELSDSYRTRASEIIGGIGNVKLIPGFAEDLGSMYPGEFDVVIAMELLEHVADPDAVCKAAAQVMAPGGIALFSVPKGFSDAIKEHVREFSIASFSTLLFSYFSRVTMVDADLWYLAEARL